MPLPCQNEFRTVQNPDGASAAPSLLFGIKIILTKWRISIAITYFHSRGNNEGEKVGGDVDAMFEAGDGDNTACCMPPRS
jgi:hypothetical protein